MPAYVLVAAMAAGAVAQGGYYPAGRILVAALVVVALALALRARPWARTDAWPVGAACAGLALWAVVRAGSVPAAAAFAGTVGGFVAVLVVLARTDPAGRERCADAVLATGALVAVVAWAGVAWRLPRFAVLVDGTLWRGGSTLTYPNAAAALLVPLALVALARRRAAVGYLLLVGVGAALSRAGFLALLLGLATLAVLARVMLRPLLGAAVAVAGLAPSFPAGAPPRPLWAVAGLLAGAVVALGPRWTLALLLPLPLVGCGPVAGRISLASAGRTGALRAALDMVSFTGTGTGRAEFFWSTADGNGQLARYVHNEYVQLLVELGVVGAVLLLGVLAACVATIRAGRRFPHRPGIRAGAIAALVALAVHSGFDFLWHIAVLPLLGALLLGLAGPATREKPTIPTEGE
jgi:hypothetical protein